MGVAGVRTIQQHGVYDHVRAHLVSWPTDPGNVRAAFIDLMDALSTKEGAAFSFKSRPGISHSFRGYVPTIGAPEGRLFVMVDIVDDDPEQRWLSVCFYGNAVSDPEAIGNLVPGGLLGEDGYCFDLYVYDAAVIAYLKERIDEAYRNALAFSLKGNEPSILFGDG